MKTKPPRSPSRSPLPKIQRSMDFYQALKAIYAGEKVRGAAWPAGEYGTFKNGELILFLKGKEYTWLVTDGDFKEKGWFLA